MRDAPELPLDVDAVLFDLDGTLADTAGDLAEAVNRMRRARGLPDALPETTRPLASSGARGLLQAGLGVTLEDENYIALRDEFLANYAACLAQTTRLFDGVGPLLAALEAHGIAWGIVTNKAERFTAPVVAALELASRAGVVVCGDTTPHPKPHPAPLLHAAKALRLAPSRCAYVGDDLRDIVAGNAAGMPTLAARWGYIGAEPIERWPATGGVDAPLDVLAWVRR